MERREERSIVERARRGDLSAFRELVEMHQKQIYYVALDFTGNHHDAEDILQDVLLKAYRSLKRFRGDSRVSTWLHRITINTCIDRGRRKSQQPTATEELASYRHLSDVSSVRGNPEQVSEAHRIGRSIDAAVQGLSPLERSVFVLRHYHDLSIREVAGALGRSEGTVKNMLWRGLRKLQKSLSAQGRELGLRASR